MTGGLNGAYFGMRSRAAGVILLLLALVGAEQTGAALLRARMRMAWQSWAAGLRAQGFTVTNGEPVATSRWLGAALVVPAVSLSGGQAIVPGGLVWQAQRLELAIDLWAPSRLRVLPQAEQVLRIAGFPPVILYAEQMTATVKLNRRRPDAIAFDAAGVSAGLDAPGRRQDWRVGALHLRLAAGDPTGHRTATEVALTAQDVGLPDDGRWPLGATIGRFSADLLLASPALSGASAADQARAWHDWGGLLTVRRLAVHWGKLDLAGEGKLALDDALQPVGEGRVRATGLAEALDALARAGTIPAGVAQAASAVLALMAPAAPDAGRPSLDLPLSLKEGTLSVGKLPVTRLPPVDWARV